MVRSAANLRAAGIERILIGTGYLADVYERCFRDAPDVTCIATDRFDSTGSLSTLYHLRDWIREGFLLLESDLFYERSALAAVLDDPRPDLILASEPTRAGDEVFIEADPHGNLVNLSKDAARLRRVDAELVGVSKLSFACAEALFRFCETALADQPRLEYEEGLARLAARRPIAVLRVDDLAWCEIDDERQYERAVREVLPRIDERDGAS